MIGGAGPAARSRCCSSMPDMPGRCTSTIMHVGVGRGLDVGFRRLEEGGLESRGPAADGPARCATEHHPRRQPRPVADSTDPSRVSVTRLQRTSTTRLRRSVTVNVAPPSGLLRATMVPPCASTIDRTIVRPIPRPCAFVVTKGVNSVPRCAPASPVPCRARRRRHRRP